MKKHAIIYFSGTGNSYQVARDLSDRLKDSEVISMADYKERSLTGFETAGIVFPTYFWGIPNIVRNFLTEVHIDKETYVYAIATCGGTQGASLHQVNDRLKVQGKRLGAGFFIIMPENYLLIFNALSKEKQEELFQKAQDKIETIAEIVKRKEQKRFEHSKYLIDAWLGRIINKAVVTKYPGKDKGFTVNDSCISCGKCAKACSLKNVVLTEGRPQWLHHCEFCMGCLQSCPKQAINWKNKTQGKNRYLNPNIL